MVEAELGGRLRELGLKLATAESCSGGLLAHRITNVAGSSNYFVGGVVSYANEAKMALLGVRPETLDSHGAVSEPVAIEMAEGVLSLLHADVAIAVTGIAGPSGGTAAKPVGLVWFAVAATGVVHAEQRKFDGDRESIKSQTAECALRLALDHLKQ